MGTFANVWPQGGLFAFSGIDGETCHAEPFVASGARDGIGWDFWFAPRLVVRAEACGEDLLPQCTPDDMCLSDCWDLAVSCAEAAGRVRGAFLNRTSMALDLQFEGEGAVLTSGEEGTRDGDVTLFQREDCWLALCEGTPGSARRYGVAVSYQDGDEAAQRARAACAANLDEAIKERLAFYEAAALPDRLAPQEIRTYYKSLSVLKVNVESPQADIPVRWTTPDRMPHRHMWLWDSAFNSMGLCHLSKTLGEEAILALLAKQREDGKLPLAAQPGVSKQEEQESQPPVVAWAVMRQFAQSEDTAFLKQVYPGLARYLGWFEANRKQDNGLFGWHVRSDDDAVRGARGGESGMDNSPRFDEITAMTAVDLSSYMAAEYRALSRMARYLEKRDESVEWQKRAAAIGELVNELLWDDEDRFYYDLDQEGQPIFLKTIAGLLPLHARIPDRDQAESLRMHVTSNHEFWTHFPLATVARDEEPFSKDMWRGPTWLNLNQLLYYALDGYGFLEEARGLARRSIEEVCHWYVRTGCIYEYYDSMADVSPDALPRKGEPGGAGAAGFGVIADYCWTAAAFVDLIHQVR